MVGCWLVVRFVGHKFPKTKGRVAPCTCSHLFQIKWDYWECICLISPSVRRSVRRSLCSKKSGYLNLHRSFRRFNFPMRPAAVLWSVGWLEAGWLVVQCRFVIISYGTGSPCCYRSTCYPGVKVCWSGWEPGWRNQQRGLPQLTNQASVTNNITTITTARIRSNNKIQQISCVLQKSLRWATMLQAWKSPTRRPNFLALA